MIEQSLKGHGKLPDPIANAPELWPWLSPYYSAFEELLPDAKISEMSGDRHPIPWSAIDRYAERHRDGVGRDFALLLLYIRELDYKHRKLIRDSRPKNTERGNKPGKPASPPRRPPPRRRR